MPRTVVAGALIIDGKILIIRRNPQEINFPNEWELPSGKVEGKESLEQALKREFFEETSLCISPGPKCCENHYFVLNKNGEKVFTKQIIFLARLSGPSKVRLSKEHTAFTWAGQEELKNYEIIKGLKKDLPKCFKRYEELEFT